MTLLPTICSCMRMLLLFYVTMFGGSGDVCSSFDGVYCGWVLGSWRVVGVQLQLDAAVVSFNDSAMAPQGALAGMSYLRELEVLCVTHRPPSPGKWGCVSSCRGREGGGGVVWCRLAGSSWGAVAP